MRVPRQAICGFALIATLGASVLIAAPAFSATASTKATTLHSLRLLINGKQLPITPFSGPDRYNPVKSSKLSVKATWQPSITGTGYKVVISTTEPTTRTWRTCSTGTSCVVPQQVPMLNGEEMSWTVRVMKVKPHFIKIIGGFMVCLARNVHPG